MLRGRESLRIEERVRKDLSYAEDLREEGYKVVRSGFTDSGAYRTLELGNSNTIRV